MKMQLIRVSKMIGLLAIALMVVATPLTADAWENPEIRDFNLECVDDDGDISAKLFSVTYYKLTNNTTSTVIDSWEDRNQPDGNLIEYTKTDLPDGEYTLYVENFDGDMVSKDFTVDCDKPEPITCPFDSSDGTVINFDDNRIRSDQSESNSKTKTANVDLEPGTYTVKLYGYDRHDGRAGQNQPQESYFVSLLSGSQEIVQTPALGDLPDGNDFGEKTRVINDFELSSSTDKAVGVHVAYPDNNANSLNALCAAFEKTAEPEKPDLELDQECVNGDGKISVTAPNGLDSYELFNVDTGASVASSSNSVTAGSVIEIDDLDDGNYRFEGTLGNDFETLTFSIDCDTPPSNNLTGICDVSPSNVETGENVTWSSSASGGDSPYTFSWDLEGSNDDADTQDITTSYSNEGTFDGTVTITDDNGDQVERTCSVRVEDDNGGGGGGPPLPPGGNGDDDDDDNGDVLGDRDFSVQCVPEESSYLIGEVVDFSATVGGDLDDEDDADWDWSGDGLRSEDNENATAQYTTTGIKEMRVEAEYDGETESDTCYVQIRAAGGITLDQVPYTGPGDTAKAVGFVLTILLLGLMGGYTVVRRREEEGIPIGIPTNQG